MCGVDERLDTTGKWEKEEGKYSVVYCSTWEGEGGHDEQTSSKWNNRIDESRMSKLELKWEELWRGVSKRQTSVQGKVRISDSGHSSQSSGLRSGLCILCTNN